MLKYIGGAIVLFDEPATPMASLLTTLGSIVTQMFSWVGDVGTAIIADPVLTFSIGIFATGAAVGLFGRLLSRN